MKKLITSLTFLFLIIIACNNDNDSNNEESNDIIFEQTDEVIAGEQPNSEVVEETDEVKVKKSTGNEIVEKVMGRWCTEQTIFDFENSEVPEYGFEISTGDDGEIYFVIREGNERGNCIGGKLNSCKRDPKTGKFIFKVHNDICNFNEDNVKLTIFLKFFSKKKIKLTVQDDVNLDPRYDIIPECSFSSYTFIQCDNLVINEPTDSQEFLDAIKKTRGTWMTKKSNISEYKLDIGMLGMGNYYQLIIGNKPYPFNEICLDGYIKSIEKQPNTNELVFKVDNGFCLAKDADNITFTVYLKLISSDKIELRIGDDFNLRSKIQIPDDRVYEFVLVERHD